MARDQERQVREPIVDPKALGMKMRRRRMRGIVDPGPNVPLLMRLIRTRYSERGAPPRRVHVREPVERLGTRDPIGHPMAEAVAWAQRPVGGPLKQNPLGLQPRPRPSADAWLGEGS